MTASPSGASITTTNCMLTDSGGHVFRWDNATTGGNFNVARDGTVITTTGGVALVAANGDTYMNRADGTWYVCSHTASSFTALSAASDGSTTTAQGAPIYTGAAFYSWGASSGSDYIILRNGVPYSNNFSASEIYLRNVTAGHMILAKTSAGAWWYQDYTLVWHPGNDPTTATSDGTQISGASGSITDSSGGIWYIHSGQVVLDGSSVSGATSVKTLLISGGSIYYVDTSGNWYKYVSGSFTSSSNPLATSLPPFITPGTGSFVIGSVTYTIDASDNAKGNGTALSGGSGTDMGALLGNQPYFRDSTQKVWYLWNGTSFLSQPVTTSGTTVTDSGGFLILSNGNVATLDTGTSKVAFNGSDDSGTSNATLVLIYNGALYYEDTTPAWHVNTALTAGSWSSTSGDPRTNVPVFADEFQAASLSIGQHMDTTKTWSYVLWYAGTSPNTWDGSLNGNGFFVNPLNAATPISGLYGVDGTDNAVLELFATPSMYSTACSNAPYVEAQMVASNFKRTYGYWEVRCKMDSVQGTNTAALWLMSNGINGHYQEIDILEANNQTGNAAAFQTIHYDNNTQDQAATYYGTSIGGTAYDSTAYHVYAVNWQPDFTTFYIDGVQTLQVATPSWYTDPMFPIVSMQAGSAGGWTPAIPGGATLPQHLYIDYIRCYPTMP